MEGDDPATDVIVVVDLGWGVGSYITIVSCVAPVCVVVEATEPDVDVRVTVGFCLEVG